jgi:phosphate starvation-inducible PhoH-like protein
LTTDSFSQYSAQTQLTLEPNNPKHLANLCGQFDEHLRLLEQRLGLRISARGNNFHLDGNAAAVKAGELLLKQLYEECKADAMISKDAIHLHLKEVETELDIALENQR